LDDFLVAEAKIGEKQDNQIQSITLCNMYFSKKVYTVYRQSPRSWGILKNFCVKTFNCKLQKKFGEQDVLVTPPII